MNTYKIFFTNRAPITIKATKVKTNGWAFIGFYDDSDNVIAGFSREYVIGFYKKER